MFYLLLVILLNTYVFTTFKLFAQYGVNSLQAISVNYWVCVATGLVTHGITCDLATMTSDSWFGHALVAGTYFIFLFNLLSYSTGTLGITATTIPNKLSLVIPVLFSYWLYNDTLDAWKISGIILSIPAVYLATTKKEERQPFQLKHLALPVMIFIFSGLLDTYLKYVQSFHLHIADTQPAFTIISFAVAAILGSAYAIIRIAWGKDKFAVKNILAGILLGIPNYFSIYYLIRLFDSNFMQSSAIIPVNNIGIVISTTLVAILLFREQAGKHRIAGVILSVISIILIALSGY
ncbi:MAG: EamA/RhaT family transporter [Chitinophagales bacterium]|nr:EamA/RhaT family transporter [Chitinophagales bacterium]